MMMVMMVMLMSVKTRRSRRWHTGSDAGAATALVITTTTNMGRNGVGSDDQLVGSAIALGCDRHHPGSYLGPPSSLSGTVHLSGTVQIRFQRGWFASTKRGRHEVGYEILLGDGCTRGWCQHGGRFSLLIGFANNGLNFQLGSRESSYGAEFVVIFEG